MVKSHVQIKTNVCIELFNAEGVCISREEKPNLVVNVGLNFMANALIANSTSPFVAVAVGTSGTAPAAGDTTLGAEVGRVAFTSATQTGATDVIVANFAAGVGTGTLQEAGIFNSVTANAGTLFSHLTFSAITKASTDSLQITWTLVMS